MEFMAPPAVQTIPYGLLGFLGVKSMGKNPSPLRDDLQPTIDLTRWYYELDSTIFGADAIAVPAAGGLTASTFIVTPQREGWWVTNIHCVTGNMPATPARDFYVAVLTAQGWTRKVFVAPKTNPAVGDTVVVAVNEPFFMWPGDALAVGHWAVASAGYNATINLKRKAFPV